MNNHITQTALTIFFSQWNLGKNTFKIAEMLYVIYFLQIFNPNETNLLQYLLEPGHN